MSSNCAIIKVMYFWLLFFVYYGQLDIDRLCLTHVYFVYNEFGNVKHIADPIYQDLSRLGCHVLFHTVMKTFSNKLSKFKLISNVRQKCIETTVYVVIFVPNRSFYCGYHYTLCYPRYASFFQIKRVPNQMIYDRMLYAYIMKYYLNLWPSTTLLHRKNK